MRTGDLPLGGLQDAAQAVGAGWQVDGTGGKAPLWKQMEVWQQVVRPFGCCPVLHVPCVDGRFLWCVSWAVAGFLTLLQAASLWQALVPTPCEGTQPECENLTPHQ